MVVSVRLMSVDKKKRLLIPLTNPRAPHPWAPFLLAILRPPFIVIGFVFGNLYKLCFGWMDKRAAKVNVQRFADEIRINLSFLFTEHGAHIIPNEGVPFPPSFDGAYVTLSVGPIRLRFCRGRGDFSVMVASEFAPQQWEDFRLVAEGISEWGMSQAGPRYYSLETFDRVLQPRLARLQEALSKERFEATLNNAVRTHNASVDEYAASLRQSGIIPKIY